MTANGHTLEPMRELIRDECGVDTQERRYWVVGCEDVDGFEAVALGEKVDTVKYLSVRLVLLQRLSKLSRIILMHVHSFWSVQSFLLMLMLSELQQGFQCLMQSHALTSS